MKLNKKLPAIFRKTILASKIAVGLILVTVTQTNSSCQKSSCEFPAQDSFPFACSNGMDVAFLIDYTGSMGGAINNIKTNVSSIVSNIIVKSSGDYRLALAIFDETQKTFPPGYSSQVDYMALPFANKSVNTTGTITNQYLTIMEPFSAVNNTTFSAQLAKLNVPGTMNLGSGAGFAEPGGMLTDKIITGAFAGVWRANKTKLCIIITDAPDGGDDDIANSIDDAFLNTLATSANTNQIQCILISSLPTGTSNYETHLINNNTSGLKLMSANFATISPKIDSMINQICINNSK